MPRTDGAFSFLRYPHKALHCGAFSYLEIL